MKLIKRPKIVYHISCCANCFYNTAVYSDEANAPICSKILTPITNESEILSECPLEEDHNDFRLGTDSYIDRID